MKKASALRLETNTVVHIDLTMTVNTAKTLVMINGGGLDSLYALYDPSGKL